MDKRKLILVATIACILMLIGGCTEKQEFLADGGFETQISPAESQTDWYATELLHTKEFVSFEWDDQIVHSGERSVSIAIVASHPDEAISYNWTTVVPGCQVGKTYELSGWIRAEDLSGPAWIVIQCWDEARTEMLELTSTHEEYPVIGTSDWTQAKVAFTVPADTAEVRIRAGIATPENRDGKVWFDDIAVRESP